MKIRVADYIATHLKNAGVRKVFLLSGGGMMHLIDGVVQSELPFVCNHHEQCSGLSAIGYAKVTKSLGVCYATSGPGATNIVTAVAEAWLDSAPVLFITGQSKQSQTVRKSAIPGLRQFGMFEIDIVPIVDSITKYSAFVDDPCSIRHELEKALFLATHGRPGPVLLDVPLDVQGALIDADSLAPFLEEKGSELSIDRHIDAVCAKLAQSKRPVLLLGNGVHYCKQPGLLSALLGKLDVPTITTALGKDLFRHDCPAFIGVVGLKGDRAANFAIQNADLVLSIGQSFHVSTIGWNEPQFAPNAYKIQVEIDEAVIEKTKRLGIVDMQIQWDLSDFLSAIAAASAKFPPAGTHSDWKARCHRWKSDFPVIAEPHKKDLALLNIYEAVDAISEHAKPGSIVVSDAGSAFYVTGQAFRVKTGQKFVSSGGFGAMGHALPVAIGAWSAEEDGEVVCITGDGSLHMTVHELQTLVQINANVKLFVLNNDGYLSIRNTQESFFDRRYIGCSIDSGCSLPNYEKLANAYGLTYARCDKTNLDKTVRSVIGSKGPVLCEMFCMPSQEIIPSVSSVKLPDGTMRSGTLDEMYPFIDPNVSGRTQP